jgi:hypothetical protein
MASTQPNFRNRDVQRLVKALRSVKAEPGLMVEVETKDGTVIRATTGKGNVEPNAPPLEQWRSKRRGTG